MPTINPSIRCNLLDSPRKSSKNVAETPPYADVELETSNSDRKTSYLIFYLVESIYTLDTNGRTITL